MLISLIHPSRSRPSMAFKAFTQWMDNATIGNNYEYILSIDIDDPSIIAYQEVFKDTGVTIMISKNRSIVDAVNIAARQSKGDMLIVVSDDFQCPPSWDALLVKLSEGVDQYGILINDGIQINTMTLPIISRALYEKIGFIYHPDYFSMFADNDITEICIRLNCLIKSELIFQHDHYITGRNPKDATYDRENSSQAYAMGKKIFERRKLENFGV